MAITLDDYVKQAERFNGGVEKIVICEFEDISSYTITDREITAIALDTGAQAYDWTLDSEAILATDNGAGNRQNNSYFRTHHVEINFKDDEDLTAQLDEEAGRSTGLVAFVKYALPAGETAKWKVYGFLNGLTLTTSEASSGQLFEDLRGHKLILESKELTRALKIADGLVTPLLTPTS